MDGRLKNRCDLPASAARYPHSVPEVQTDNQPSMRHLLSCNDLSYPLSLHPITARAFGPDPLREAYTRQHEPGLTLLAQRLTFVNTCLTVAKRANYWIHLT